MLHVATRTLHFIPAEGSAQEGLLKFHRLKGCCRCCQKKKKEKETKEEEESEYVVPPLPKN